jgi:hypothetical protein
MKRRKYRLASSGDDASLRRAAPAIFRFRGAAHALRRALDHGGVEPASDDREDSTIGDTPCNTAHQVPVWNGVEVVREIGIDDFAGSTIGNAEVNASQRHVRVQLGAKAVLPRR